MRGTIVQKLLLSMGEYGIGPELFPPDLLSTGIKWCDGDKYQSVPRRLSGGPGYRDPAVSRPGNVLLLSAEKSAYKGGSPGARRGDGICNYGKWLKVSLSPDNHVLPLLFLG